MIDLYAKKCSCPYFVVTDKGKEHRIYKFSYYWSNVGEAYVLVLSIWLPKEKRVRIPFCKTAPNAPRWKSPTIVYAMPRGLNSRSEIRKISAELKSKGRANIDRILNRRNFEANTR